MIPVTAEQMSELDRRAREEYGIEQSLLMENAGKAVFGILLKDLPKIKEERIALFCGKGNNGGDGFVVARYLSELAPDYLKIYVTDPGNVRQGASLDNLKEIKRLGLDICPLTSFLEDPRKQHITVAVDSIFGTGFRGGLPTECSELGKVLNHSDANVYSVDVPTGLNATTGEASFGCVKAKRTVTFGLPKIGFYEKDGPSFCGEITVCDIGFPESLLEQYI